MTKSEAIDYFIRSYSEEDTEDAEQHNEALDMAIQALENHMDYDKGFKDGIKYAMEHTELE